MRGLEFPENRENNREFHQFPGILTILGRKFHSRPKALHCKSLLQANREFFLPEQGIDPPNREKPGSRRKWA